MYKQQSATKLYLLLETLKPKTTHLQCTAVFGPHYVSKEKLLERACYNFKYSQSPLYRQPLNMDTSLLQTVCFVPGERKPLHFL